MIIAITGTIGAGKSSVSDYFKSQGYAVYDADKMVHAYYNPGQAVYKWLVARFSDDILNDDTSLNRQILAQHVFSNPKELKALEDVVFPLVEEEILKIKSSHKNKLIFVEVPLLFEAEMDKLFDKIITVDALEDIRHQRLSAKGLSKEDFKAREARQFSAQEKRKKADIIVDNNTTLKQLYIALETIERSLLDEEN